MKVKNQTKNQNPIQLNLLKHQNLKPDFTYIQPIKITDQQFPEELQQQNNQQIMQTLNNQIQSLRAQQTLTLFNQPKNIQSSKIKVDKSVFVKIKQINYKKFYKTINKKIGQGAFGTVSKVQSLTTRQYRAAKIIKKGNISNSQIQKLFEEVYIMMELDHHNIANLLQVYEYDQNFTLICQLCEGGDLLKYLKSQNKENVEKIAGKIIKQLLRAIMYLHSKGIVHRDIKPHNILFQKNNSHNIKLIDFGIATKIEENQILKLRVGTPAYLAPELIFQKYNQKVDIWAIGITMYHIIAGQIPFKGASIKETMSAILKQKVSFKEQIWENISSECKQVINIMTNKNPKQRPSAKQIFQHSYFKSIQENDLSNQQKIQFVGTLRKLQFKNKLQTTIQNFVASQLLSIEQKKQLVQYFKQFDQNNDGVISKEELYQILQIKKKISKQRVQAIMNMIDTNKSGKIDFTQFVATCFIDSQQFTVNRIKQAFAHFDTNKNGTISFKQVKYFMKQLVQNDQQLQKLFQKFDINRDGNISQIQFIHIMLQRTKYMALSKVRNPKSVNQIQKRMDQLTLNKMCIQYIFQRGGQPIDFFKQLAQLKS